MSASDQPYAPVSSYNTEKNDPEDLPFNHQDYFTAKKRSRPYSIALFLVRLFALLLVAGFVFKFWDIFLNLQTSLDHLEAAIITDSPETSSPPMPGHGHLEHPVKQCVNPIRRPAWHELSIAEKMEYIRAVNCLPTKPSYIHPNSTVYDDFTWLHIVDGDQIHFAAANLPWHRWHLHLYELALQRECGFKGVLPYWDWELDNEGTKESDFFHPVHGFGGNSLNTDMYKFNDQNIPLFDDKHCIKDGPFKWLQPQWTGAIAEGPTFWPHCLTRRYSEQFIEPKKDHVFYGFKFSLTHTVTEITLDFSKEGIAKLLAMTDYEEFNLAVEDLHTWLAQALLGEYLTLQASNDPTFFPHLAKIDQIWWRWQEQNNQKNLWEYNGQARRSTPNPATLDDIMIFHTYPGMQRDVIRARDVMSTKTDLLCYTY